MKYPRHTAIWLICIVTQVLIVGYELQVKKIGQKAAAAGGQPYYPIYILAPYRLAAVAGGSLVAFIWTSFPYPITDRYVSLPKWLGSCLENLHPIDPGFAETSVRHCIFWLILMLSYIQRSVQEWMVLRAIWS